MTASIKEREDKLCDREDYVEDQKLSENKEEQLNSEEHWKRKRELEIQARKEQVERTKTVSYLTGTH